MQRCCLVSLEPGPRCFIPLTSGPAARGLHLVSRGPTTAPLEVLQQQMTIEQRLAQAIGPNLPPKEVIDEYEVHRTEGWGWEKYVHRLPHHFGGSDTTPYRTNRALDLSISVAVSMSDISMYMLNQPGACGRLFHEQAIGLLRRIGIHPGDAIDHSQRALDLIEAAREKWSSVPASNQSMWLAPPLSRGVLCG